VVAGHKIPGASGRSPGRFTKKKIPGKEKGPKTDRECRQYITEYGNPDLEEGGEVRSREKNKGGAGSSPRKKPSFDRECPSRESRNEDH